MRRYWFWGVAAFLVLSMLLAGCGGKQEQTQSQGKQKITYMYAGGTANDEIVKQATKLFKHSCKLVI